MMKKTCCALLAAMMVLLLAAMSPWNSDIGAEDYLAQIDNTQVAELRPAAEMTHAYSLTGCEPAGESKDQTFRTKRVLHSTAFLKLTVAPLCSVRS